MTVLGKSQMTISTYLKNQKNLKKKFSFWLHLEILHTKITIFKKKIQTYKPNKFSYLVP